MLKMTLISIHLIIVFSKDALNYSRLHFYIYKCCSINISILLSCLPSMCSSDGADDLAGVPGWGGPVCVQLAQSLSERARCGAFSLSARHLRENQTTGAGKDPNPPCATESDPGFIGALHLYSTTQLTPENYRCSHLYPLQSDQFSPIHKCMTVMRIIPVNHSKSLPNSVWISLTNL